MDARIKITKNNPTKLIADAIICPVDHEKYEINGDNYKIFHLAGEALQFELSQKGKAIPGKIVITRGYDLKVSRIIHAIGPIQSINTGGEEHLLQISYRRALAYCKKNMSSVVIGELGNSVFNIPKFQKIRIIANEINNVLSEESCIKRITIACSTNKGFDLFNLFLNHNESSDVISTLLNTYDNRLMKLKNNLLKVAEREHYKNLQIEKSIEYARRIQNAILPSEELFNKSFHDYFIIDCPRNIVSGDFYWISKKKDKVIFAIGDCTGHGVPGALMSMLGVSFLNEIVNSERIHLPSEILNCLRERIVKTMNQTGMFNESKDGIDISLCAVNYEERSISFSGAYNPLYIIRSKKHPCNLINDYEESDSYDPICTVSEDENNLIEIKGDRMSVSLNPQIEFFNKDTDDFKLKRKVFISKLKSEYPFSLKKLNFFPEDEIYLFSDGFVNQIGGPSGKKFRSIQFKKMLLSLKMSCNTFEQKKDQLEKTFKRWKGEFNQIDDIMILGVKL